MPAGLPRLRGSQEAAGTKDRTKFDGIDEQHGNATIEQDLASLESIASAAAVTSEQCYATPVEVALPIECPKYQQ